MVPYSGSLDLGQAHFNLACHMNLKADLIPLIEAGLRFHIPSLRAIVREDIRLTKK